MKKALLGLAALPIALVVVFIAVLSGAPKSTTLSSCVDNTTATGKVTPAQLAAAAYAAGVRGGGTATQYGSGDTLVIVVALAEPESGDDASAVQQGQPYATTGWGAWQVTPGNSEPQCGTDEKLLSLTANACAMAAKLKAQGLKAWSTYQQALYLPFMAEAQIGVSNMSSAGLSCQPSQASSAQLDARVNASGQPVQEATPPGLCQTYPTFDSYPCGQCTFWAAMHLPVPPYLGNAADWWANAATKGMQETQTPTEGSVVVYGPGGGYSSVGHVAYVLHVNADGTFVVSEMNYLGVGLVDERSSTSQDVLGFIL